MSKSEELWHHISKAVTRIISAHAWKNWDGRCDIHEENFENLEIELTGYIAPLLQKAGWFIDEDDKLLTCCRKVDEEQIDKQIEETAVLKRRSPVDQKAYLHIKLAEIQLESRHASEKLCIAIKTLRLLADSDRLTKIAVCSIAQKALDDLAGTGNPERTFPDGCINEG